MKQLPPHFDALVVGGGHAGIEATRALAARGCRVALVSLDIQKIGAMSCNPAIGGVAKSHLVYEVDALGGLMGYAADRSAIQSRRLNLRKGPAVRSTRVQCDKDRYTKFLSETFAHMENVTLLASEVAGLDIDNSVMCGVRLKDGTRIRANAVVVTAGTFMRGLMFCGFETQSGGRYGDTAADLLTQDLLSSGHRIKRLKTGTPARLKAETIDFARCARQWGDPEKRRFSWRKSALSLPQLSCFMTYTNEKTHEVIRQNFSKSPLFSGQIQGVGPRYCPSVEDKVKRFADRDRHQIFLEPEGLDTNSVYPNGLSTSLPADVQLEFLRTIVGLESVELARPGYAVEYDTLDPTELTPALMSKHVAGLFFAGQVNRTSGYEEAAAQGLWAGIQASLYIDREEPITPVRSRSYIETLVDDLTTVGTEEPYRMFTSRSEYRLLLREDNAGDRLFELGTALGLLSPEQRDFKARVSAETAALKQKLSVEKVRLDENRVVSLFEYLKRPEIIWEDIVSEHVSELMDCDVMDLALEKVEIDAKYSGYLVKQEREVEELNRMRAWRLDRTVDIAGLQSLSNEIVEKYRLMKPSSVYELSRISGMTPGALLAIARHAGRLNVSRETELASLALPNVSRETPLPT